MCIYKRYRQLEYLMLLAGIVTIVARDCPHGYCTLGPTTSTNGVCNIEADDVCSPETYCHGYGQCFKDRGSPNVFCNCTEDRYGNHCQYPYMNPLIRSCTTNSDCNNAECIQQRCHCLQGYRGANCKMETRVLVTNETLSNMCKNGGTLYVQASKYLCRCPCGYTGDYCEDLSPTVEPPTVNKCNNGHLYNITGLKCRCNCGYFGQFCEYSSTPNAYNYKDWCDDEFKYCHNGANCIKKPDSCKPTCYCLPGYEVVHCNETRTTPATENTDIKESDDIKTTNLVVYAVAIGTFVVIQFCIFCVFDRDYVLYCRCCCRRIKQSTPRMVARSTDRNITNTTGGHTRERSENESSPYLPHIRTIDTRTNNARQTGHLSESCRRAIRRWRNSCLETSSVNTSTASTIASHTVQVGVNQSSITHPQTSSIYKRTNTLPQTAYLPEPSNRGIHCWRGPNIYLPNDQLYYGLSTLDNPGIYTSSVINSLGFFNTNIVHNRRTSNIDTECNSAPTRFDVNHVSATTDSRLIDYHAQNNTISHHVNARSSSDVSHLSVPVSSLMDADDLPPTYDEVFRSELPTYNEARNFI